VLRGYEHALRQRILPDLGGARLGDVTRLDVQDLADRLLAEGLDPSTVRNAVMPLRAVYRRALVRGDVAVNPTTGLELAAVRGRRERTADPVELEALLGVVPLTDRALWATAFYAGLRLGELRALRFADLDLNAEPHAVLRVERSWDQVAGAVEPKSRAGTRTVPVVDHLRRLLREHRLALGRGDGLVFGRDADRPFNPSSVYRRAFDAWEKAGLEPIRLHECRHSFVSLWHDAGVSLERIADYAGHASTGMTNRYRHLRDTRRADDVALVNLYLAAQVRETGRVVEEGGH